MDKISTSVGRVLGAIRSRAKSSTAKGLASRHLANLGLENSTRPMEEILRSANPSSNVIKPGTAGHSEARRSVRMTQEHFLKEDPMAAMLRGYTEPLNPNPPKFGSDNPFMTGFSSEISKLSASFPTPATIEEGIPMAKTLSAKILGVLKRRPGLATVTAAAAGAGAGMGLAQAKEKKEGEEKRREEIRQLLMSRLQEGGYAQ